MVSYIRLCLIILPFILVCAVRYAVEFYLFTNVEPDNTLIHSLINEEYDYIVVGSGTASSVLVNTLVEGFAKTHQTPSPLRVRDCTKTLTYSVSTDPQQCAIPGGVHFRPRILVLEAGPQMNWLQKVLSDIPLTAAMLFGLGADRIYSTTSQKSAAYQLKNQQLLLPAGRILGGTATLNALIFSLGHKTDETIRLFHAWDPEFTADMFSTETNTFQCRFKPELVYEHPATTRIHDALRELFHGLGLPVIDKPSGWSSEGLHAPLAFTQNGKRWHPYEKCLVPVMSRYEDASITIAPNTIAERLIWNNNTSNRAIGVRVWHKGISLTVRLAHQTSSILTPESEVILGAGAFETPAILMRSGIGPADVFKSHRNIKQRLNLPVGYNLHDHPMVGVIGTLNESVSISSRILTPLEVVRYFWNKRSALAQSSALVSVAYLRTSIQRTFNLTRPDIQFTFIAAAAIEQETFRTLGNFKPEAWRKFIPPAGHDLKNTMVILISLVAPLSRGRVRLQQRLETETFEPFPGPEINPAYFTHPTDVERLVEATTWLYAVLQQSPDWYRPARPEAQAGLPPHRSSPRSSEQIRRIGLCPHLPSYPNCPQLPVWTAQPDRETLAQWDMALPCLVTSSIVSNYHYAGSCATQGVNKPVLSRDLRVIGVENVRVADASVIPTLITSNPAATIMSIGRYAAKSILNGYWSSLSEHMSPK